jgi:hypothetical protein
MVTSLGRGVFATLLVVLMAVGSVAMWIVTPIFWLWLVSQFSESSSPSLGLYMLVLVGTIATIVVLGKLLGFLNRVHGTITGRMAPRRDQTVWMRSMRGDRNAQRDHGVLGTVMAVSVSIALVAMGVWFFFFAEGGGI